MNQYEGLMSMEDIPPEMMRALAEKLRGRGADGGSLSTSTIAPVAEQGSQMQKDSLLTASGIGDMSYRKEALKAQKADSLLRAKAAMISASSKAAKERGFHKPSGTSTEKYETKANTIANIAGQLSRWNPEYTASLPLLGGVDEFMGRNKYVPSTGMQEEMAAWWSDWKRDYENIVRHDLFGSALTASEKEEWKKANITSNMDPDVIASKMETLSRLNDLAASRSVRSAINKDWDPTYAFDEYEGIVPEYAKESRGGLDRWVRESRERYNSPSPIQTMEGGSRVGEDMPRSGDILLDDVTGLGNLQDLSDEEFQALLDSRSR